MKRYKVEIPLLSPINPMFNMGGHCVPFRIGATLARIRTEVFETLLTGGVPVGHLVRIFGRYDYIEFGHRVLR